MLERDTTLTIKRLRRSTEFQQCGSSMARGYLICLRVTWVCSQLLVLSLLALLLYFMVTTNNNYNNALAILCFSLHLACLGGYVLILLSDCFFNRWCTRYGCHTPLAILISVCGILAQVVVT